MIPKDVIHQIAAYLVSPSMIGDHGQACCRNALAWLHGVDASNSYRDGYWQPPTWLRKEYDWGPIAWPLHWCSISEMEKLDCGALAAAAVQLYRMRGQPATHVQLALRYPTWAAEQWSRMWEREGLEANWISGEFCYHEACGVLKGADMHLWDSTENRWLEPPVSPNEAFASVMALKIAEDREGIEKLHWGAIPVRRGLWQSVAFEVGGQLASSC